MEIRAQVTLINAIQLSEFATMFYATYSYSIITRGFVKLTNPSHVLTFNLS